MKKTPTLLIVLLCLLLNNVITNAAQIPDSILISTEKDDVTDDGLKEIIELKGVLLSKGSHYYQDIWIEVTSTHMKQWKIPFGGGYDPQVQLLDLNNDLVNNIFYQSATSDKDKSHAFHLYSLKHGIIKEISLPEHQYMKGHLKNNFQVQIQTPIKKNDKSLLLNIETKADEYIEHNLYSKQGKLLKPEKVIIVPIHRYEPVLMSKRKGYGLKSYQAIRHMNLENELGIIETLWYFENNQWVAIQTNLNPTD